jgi:glycosyltransferase involved in cell wall biosynthesis
MTIKRIAYLVSQYPASSHTFIRREVESLRARGVPILTFSIRRPSPGELTAPEDRASFEETTFVLPLSPTKLASAHLRAIVTRPLAYVALLRLATRHRAPGARALLWSLFHFAEAIVLAAQLTRAGVTHLHNHFANAGATVGMLAARFAKLPWSLTLHGISETDYPAGLMLGEKLAAADFAACVSWFGRAQAMRTTAPDHWHKFMIVRCGLDLSDPRLPAPAPRDATPRRRIVCVARLSAEKGHLGLLDALAALRERGVDAELALVGDGPLRDMIEQRIAALALEDRVHFLGRLDETATLAEVAPADLLVLPSFMEGLPIVLMEAMALGVPVIGSRVAGVPELIEDGVEGLLFRPGDWDDLTGKIARVLGEPGLGDRMALAARAKVEREFDVRQAVDPLVDRFS